jgi:hypothetical protein
MPKKPLLALLFLALALKLGYVVINLISPEE